MDFIRLTFLYVFYKQIGIAVCCFLLKYFAFFNAFNKQVKDFYSAFIFI